MYEDHLLTTDAKTPMHKIHERFSGSYESGVDCNDTSAGFEALVATINVTAGSEIQ